MGTRKLNIFNLLLLDEFHLIVFPSKYYLMYQKRSECKELIYGCLEAQKAESNSMKTISNWILSLHSNHQSCMNHFFLCTVCTSTLSILSVFLCNVVTKIIKSTLLLFCLRIYLYEIYIKEMYSFIKENIFRPKCSHDFITIASWHSSGELQSFFLLYLLRHSTFFITEQKWRND